MNIDPAFPLAHRMDLPEHERGISAESLAALDAAIEEGRRGELIDLGSFAQYAEDDPDEEPEE